GLALQGHDFRFGEGTLGNWQDAMELIHHVDDVMDTNDPVGKERTSKYLASLFSGNALPDDHHPNNSLMLVARALRARITDDQAHSFYSTGARVIEVADRYKQTTNLRQHVKLVRHEGELTTDMLDAIATREDVLQPGYSTV